MNDLIEIRSQIIAAIQTLGRVNGFGHNVISCCLRSIEKYHGREAANATIRELHLDKEGWTEE